MKAVIMAGGKGTRLRPLTCNIPKPMVSLLGRPCMEYIIDLLKRYGITDIAVTMQYLPDVIRSHFGDGQEYGVQIQYFEETVPLGTAGSVKNAESFLDEPFLVISGDGLTDFDLEAAMAFHRSKGSAVTIVLTRVETPLEYGVVMTDHEGRIVRFLEKPSWGEVFSDTVNTGIYIIEPEVLDLIPADTEFDFSKDLFPLVMKHEMPLYGYVASGYWSDVGNLTQYRRTQFDMLDGLVDVRIRGKLVGDKIWAAEDAKVDKDAVLVGPSYIGSGTRVASGAVLGEYAILFDHVVVNAGASVRRAVVGNYCNLDQGAELLGCTLANRVRVEMGTSVAEDAVIGDQCVLGAQSSVRANVKLWPNKTVQNNSTVHTSLIWGETAFKTLFGDFGVSGTVNVDITPDFAAKLASTYGSTLPMGAKVSVSSDGVGFCEIIKQSFAMGLVSAGIHVVDIGTAIGPVARHAIREVGANAGGIHVREMTEADRRNQIIIEFYDDKGLALDKGRQRKVENAYWQEDYRRAEPDQIAQRTFAAGLTDAYLSAMWARTKTGTIQNGRLRVIVHYEGSSLQEVMPRVFDRLGCKAMHVSYPLTMMELCDAVRRQDADLGVMIDPNGQTISLVDETGEVVTEEMLYALRVLVTFYDAPSRVMAVPVNAPGVVEKLAEQMNGRIVRTKSSPRSIMEVTKDEAMPLWFDGIVTLVKVIEYMCVQQLKLSEVVATIPVFHVRSRSVPCPWTEKGKVMRLLMEEVKGRNVELIDGIKVYEHDGWTLIQPDTEQPIFRIFAQAPSGQLADQWVSSYEEKINSYRAM